MTQWNLSRLRYTVRKLTGKLDPSQIADSSSDSAPIDVNNQPGLDDYINDFYLYDMDEHLRVLPLRQYYTFQTIPNVGTYSLPSNFNPNVNNFPSKPIFYNASNPIYCDGLEIAWYQDPTLFYRIWPELDFIQQNIAQGDGFTQTFSFILSSLPIQQGTVSIGVTPPVNGTIANPFQNESFTDLDTPGAFINPGTLYSSLTGLTTTSSAIAVPPNTISSVNYLTGQVVLTFTTAPANGSQINVHYWPYVASRPRDCLFYNQNFFLRPIPNDVYKIKMVAYAQPTVLLENTGQNPFLQQTGLQFTSATDLAIYNEWWQTIAYGAAMKILIEDGDHEEAARYETHFEKAKLLAQRRALKQFSNQRIQTPYAPDQGGATPFPVFPIY